MADKRQRALENWAQATRATRKSLTGDQPNMQKTAQAMARASGNNKDAYDPSGLNHKPKR
jgi:hypothetical protein